MEWFPWYPALYKADTMHLTAEQDGIYRRLIDHYMETRTPLLDNDAGLARVAGVSLDCWNTHAATIRAFFKADTRGFLRHKRCDAELSAQDRRTKSQSQKGKNGAKKRWEKTKENQPLNSSGYACAMAGAMPNDSTQQDRTGQDRTGQSVDRVAPVERDIASGTLPGLPPAVPRPDPIPEAFEVWWKGWTPHGGCPRGHKQDALKAYRKAISQGAEPDVLTRQRDAYLAECRRVDQFTRHASTWLNGRGWLESYDAGAGPGPAANRDAGARNRSGERQGPASIVLAAQRVADAMQRGLDHDTGGRSGPLDGGDVVQ